MFKCMHSGCDAADFEREDDLKKHIATCHNQRYVCSYCGRNLASPETLRGHIKKHTNKDDFKCVVPGCPEVNWRRESMGTHLMKHEAELREALNLYTRFKGREEDLHKALEMYAVFKVHGGVLQEALNVYYKELAKRQPQNPAAEPAEPADDSTKKA